MDELRDGGKTMRENRDFRRSCGRAVWALGLLAPLALAGCRSDKPAEPPAEAGWTAKVEEIARAAAAKDAPSGVEICGGAGACQALAKDGAVGVGSRVKTDERTRARLRGSDGSELVLDRDTEIEVVAGKARTARVVRGGLLADVAPSDAPPAVLLLAGARIDAPTARFTVIADKALADVAVARGAVRLFVDGEANAAGTLVQAGEQARLAGTAPPVVHASTALTELDAVGAVDEAHAARESQSGGLGELRAKKPGSTTEQEQKLRIAKARVAVRIADSYARTEIEEVFANDSAEELEGIFRFPLPPDANLERLALEVDGKLEEGAFVERDRAKAIWRGVIQNAVAENERKALEDIIWRPGPWRDPALLEAQRGGRFELRIFPIKAKSSRRVILGYTQLLRPGVGVRSYSYPLAYDRSAEGTIGEFSADVQVIGHKTDAGLRARGYAFKSAEVTDTKAERVVYEARGFLPAGSFSVEYTIPGDASEVTAWGYRPEKPLTPGDDGAFVAMTLRPKLPRWVEGKHRDYVLVVDASRSMKGERFARASKLAASIVRGMDTRDRFAVLACDGGCRAMAGALAAPSPGAPDDVARFLGAVEPDGGSDVAAAVHAAQKLAGVDKDRVLRVVYLGDGAPTVGPTRPATLAAVVERTLPGGIASVIAVPVSADSDPLSLAALARGGGGIVVPFAAGETIAAASRAVLAASYGVSLRAPVLELPPGLTQVSPETLDTIPAGGEAVVVARMKGQALDGPITLRGRVGDDPFEQVYALKLAPTSSPANAFVPRLFAATRIADLERARGDAAKVEMVALSKQFAVASPYTSLLVLESEAMFQAFGIDRARTVPTWTGEQGADAVAANGANTVAEDADVAGLGALGGLGGLAKASAPAAASPAKPTGGSGGLSGIGSSGARGDGPGGMMDTAGRLEGRSLPPSALGAWGNHARVVWVRKGDFAADASAVANEAAAKIAAAEAQVAAHPDSRTKVAELLKLYVRAGTLDRAQELASRWTTRDPLDPEALRARADLAMRMGDRAGALRIAEGVLDVKLDDRPLHAQLAKAFDAAGDRSRACAHRVALADAPSKDAASAVAAVRCLRDLGEPAMGDVLLRGLDAQVRVAADKALAAALPPPASGLSGDVQLDASWDVAEDLDLALIDPAGRRLGWSGGGKAAVSVVEATGARHEALGFASLPVGIYVVEIARTAPGRPAAAPTRGTVHVKVLGQSHAVPFTLAGDRATLGRVRLSLEREEIMESGAAPMTGTVVVNPRVADGEIADAPAIAARARAGLRLCYQQAMRVDPSAEGRLMLRLAVDPSGDVTRVDVTESGLPPSLVACAQGRARRLKFDNRGDRPASVLFVLVFARGGP